MKLGHILWPSDPVSRESSDPETQLTRWPCSIMNSKCRLSVKKYSQAKDFLIIIGKSKSSLHGLTSSDLSPTTDTWQWLLTFQHFKCTFCILGIFSKTGETRVSLSHRVKKMTRWPGRERWPKWPIDPVDLRLECRPAVPRLANNLGQVVHTHVLPSPSSMYRSRGGDALRPGR